MTITTPSSLAETSPSQDDKEPLELGARWDVVALRVERGLRYAYSETARLCVPGGWIYREVVSGTGDELAVTTVFVPRRWWNFYAETR